MHISFALVTIYFTYKNKIEVNEMWMTSQIFVCKQATLVFLVAPNGPFFYDGPRHEKVELSTPGLDEKLYWPELIDRTWAQVFAYAWSVLQAH